MLGSSRLLYSSTSSPPSPGEERLFEQLQQVQEHIEAQETVLANLKKNHDQRVAQLVGEARKKRGRARRTRERLGEERPFGEEFNGAASSSGTTFAEDGFAEDAFEELGSSNSVAEMAQSEVYNSAEEEGQIFFGDAEEGRSRTELVRRLDEVGGGGPLEDGTDANRLEEVGRSSSLQEEKAGGGEMMESCHWRSFSWGVGSVVICGEECYHHLGETGVWRGQF